MNPSLPPAPTRHRGDRRRRIRRFVALGVVAVLVVLGVAAATDLLVAARAEQRLSRALAAAPAIIYRPEVTLSGFPFITHARSGEFGGATITARGVPVSGCGYGRADCFAELGASLGHFTVPDGFSIGAADVIRADSVSTHTLLNSVILGRFLGILDLTVNTPAAADRVGGGGPQFGNLERRSGVVLTGTVALPPTAAPVPDLPPDAANSPAVAGYRSPSLRVSVSVDLSIRDGRLHIEATGLYSGPEEHADARRLDGTGTLDGIPKTVLRQQILERFSTTLPRLPMPWDLAPTDAHSAGSDIIMTASTGQRTVRPADF